MEFLSSEFLIRGMNIFEMYYARGKKAGFWVFYNARSDIAAKIISIAGITEGPIIDHGRYPLFLEAEKKVLVEVYKVSLLEGDVVAFDQIPAKYCAKKLKNSHLGKLDMPFLDTFYKQVDLESPEVLVRKIGEEDYTKVTLEPAVYYKQKPEGKPLFAKIRGATEESLDALRKRVREYPSPSQNVVIEYAEDKDCIKATLKEFDWSQIESFKLVENRKRHFDNTDNGWYFRLDIIDKLDLIIVPEVDVPMESEYLE
ncbi:hypothetical protein ACI2KR_30495 [Pseudomonas luteola]